MKKLKKAREDVLIMAFMAIVCLLLYFWIIPKYIPVPRAAEGESFTPRTLPYLLTAVMSLCTIWGFISYGTEYFRVKKSLEPCEKEEKEEKTLHERMNEAIPYIIFMVVVAYGIMINFFGFIISTIIMVPVVLWIIGCRKWNYYAIVYAFSAVMWLVFKMLLKIQLP